MLKKWTGLIIFSLFFKQKVKAQKRDFLLIYRENLEISLKEIVKNFGGFFATPASQ